MLIPRKVFDKMYKNLTTPIACLKISDVKKAIDKIRKKNCDVLKDGCKGSAGCCDSCNTIEDIEEELGL